MKTVFFDVGSHRGQTLEEVMKPIYPFERIVAFEPMPREFRHLLMSAYASDPRVKLINMALGAKDSDETFMYGDNGALEASIYQKKRDVDPSISTRICMGDASKMLREELHEDEQAVVNLNCEGSEIPILHNLIDTQTIWRCAEILIDFDIRKVPGQEGEERRVMDRLGEIGFNRFSLAEHVMVGHTHQEQIANWLRVTGWRNDK